MIITRAKDNTGFYCFNGDVTRTFLDNTTGKVCPQFHLDVSDQENPVLKAESLLKSRYSDVIDPYYNNLDNPYFWVIL